MAAGGSGDAQIRNKRKRREDAEKGAGGDAKRRNKRKRREAAANGGGDARKRPHGAPAARGGAKENPQPVTAGVVPLLARFRPWALLVFELELKRRGAVAGKFPNCNRDKELTALWEKMRHHDVSKADRTKLVTEALHKMNGNYLEIAKSRVTASVLQKCVKWCSESEREAIFVALHKHLHLKYAAFVVKKLIKFATRAQLAWFISSLEGNVASLLCHAIGAAVVDCAFQRATPLKRRGLLYELYTTDRQLFWDLTNENNSLLETISKLALEKSSVQQYMTTTVIQPILEKGIVEYSIVHTVILEYLTIADKTSASDVIRQLIPHLTQGAKTKAKEKISAGPLLIRIMHTREGLKLGLGCLKHGSAKERKKIIKGLKGHIMKLALNDNGCLFLVCLLSIADDTKLVTKIVIKELAKELKQLVFDKNGRRPLLQLLHPLCSRYLPWADLACLNYSVHSLISKDEATESASVKLESKLDVVADKEHGASEDILVTSDSKKDPFRRRHELLMKSELAEALVQICIENVGELLRTNFGKDVLYEVAVGGKDNVLEGITHRIHLLHEAIASHAACLKADDVQHAFNNYQSSRIIRRMILDCPAFAATLWKEALEGKCTLYADGGHSSKVVTAFLESPDSMVKDLAKSELQELIDSGILTVNHRT